MNFTASLPSYLPDIDYFRCMINAQFVILIDHFQYTKRSSLTRGVLSTDQLLSIPVANNGYQKPIYSKKINNSENWHNKHLKNIYHIYKNCPFFYDYFEEFSLIYQQKEDLHLIDFLKSLLQFYFNKLQFSGKIILSSSIVKSGNLTTDFIKFGQELHLQNYFHRKEEKTIIDHKLLEQQNIKVSAITSIEHSGKTSVLDLLFNYGPEAAFIIRGK